MTHTHLDLRTSSEEPHPPEFFELERTWLSPPEFLGWFTHVNPWNAPTLEWAITSPPLNCNFAEQAVVGSDHPLWDWKATGKRAIVGGLSTAQRETIVTTLLDARAQSVQILPKPTPWPFVSAVVASICFFGVIFSPWFYVAGILGAFATFVMWFLPRKRDEVI
ncbi:hypothetical protein [Roseitranquillus sediminis]|uniref:hypothetical protein n=1 Tax=Roseitranquillus sediminis TaxID=2809051 RepID=UPI001D0C0D49|nr:hypothetical protein [Roseitranquillus sediminis]MBM9595129.1 hypothetical protein [Roseitranquillus sediminis]